MNLLRTRWGLVIKALLIVAPVLALKVLMHYLGFEIISVGPIVTALITGTFFVIAIILSGVLSDFKECEKIPGELVAAIEALYKHARLTGIRDAEREILRHVHELTHVVAVNFQRKGSWKLSEVNNVIDVIDDDIRLFAANGAFS